MPGGCSHSNGTVKLMLLVCLEQVAQIAESSPAVEREYYFGAIGISHPLTPVRGFVSHFICISAVSRNVYVVHDTGRAGCP